MIKQEEDNNKNTNKLLRPRYGLVFNKCKWEHQEKKNRFEICSRMYYKVPQNNSFVNTIRHDGENGDLSPLTFGQFQSEGQITSTTYVLDK